MTMLRITLHLCHALLGLLEDDADMNPPAISLRRALREYISFKEAK